MGDYAHAHIRWGGDICLRTLRRILSESSDVSEASGEQIDAIVAAGQYEDESASGAMFSDLEASFIEHAIEFDRGGCHPDYGDYHGCYRRGWDKGKDLREEDGDKIVSVTEILKRIADVDEESIGDLKRWLENEYVIPELEPVRFIEDAEENVIHMGDLRRAFNCSPGTMLVRLYDDHRMFFCPMNEHVVPSPLYIRQHGWMPLDRRPHQWHQVPEGPQILQLIAHVFDTDVARSLSLTYR